MKYYTFYRENNNFNDILKDKNVKSKIRFKIQWSQHLLIGFEYEKPDEKILGYLVLKYGDDIKNIFEYDYSPIPNIDYIPVKNNRSNLD